MKAEIKINHYSIKLLWDGFVWVHLKRSEFVAYHSWSDGNGAYSIEFITKTNSFVVEQDDKDKWLTVLKILNEKI